MSCDHKVTTTAVMEKVNWPDLVNVDYEVSTRR